MLCKALKVKARGYRAWRCRPASQRQRDDLVILAHIREQQRLSLGSYALPGSGLRANHQKGRPRMTEELKEAGLGVGHRLVGRLMQENGIKAIRTRKYKPTTDSNHRHPIAANLLDGDFAADAPNQKWADDITYSAPRPGRTGVRVF